MRARIRKELEEMRDSGEEDRESEEEEEEEDQNELVMADEDEEEEDGEHGQEQLENEDHQETIDNNTSFNKEAAHNDESDLSNEATSVVNPAIDTLEPNQPPEKQDNLPEKTGGEPTE